jgi:CheY-like chemotaxis protein
LIQQMLTFSRGQRGQRRPLLLPPLVKEAVRLLRSSLPSTVEIDADLGREVSAVSLDPVHIDQVLLNLGINARDAMDGVGSIQIAVDQGSVKDMTCASCRQSFDGDFVELRVEDNGPGITPEVLDRMFEPFYTTKEVGKGSGMGLSTVHGIVHEHGGHVVVETSSGHGARFRVLFPAMQRTSVEAQIPPCGDGRGAAPRSRLQGHVLVIDDEKTVCEFMRDMLEGWGLDVTAIADPSEARGLVAAAPDRYSIVITDQTMPKITGIELARELLSLRPDLPVILYTGLSDGVVQREVDALGIRALMRKPIEPPTLFNLLEKHLSVSP